jgi:hypothetical protein
MQVSLPDYSMDAILKILQETLHTDVPTHDLENDTITLSREDVIDLLILAKKLLDII